MRDDDSFPSLRKIRGSIDRDPANTISDPKGSCDKPIFWNCVGPPYGGDYLDCLVCFFVWMINDLKN